MRQAVLSQDFRVGLGVCVNVYIHTLCSRGQKRASDLLDVGVTDKSHRVGVGSRTLVFCKSSVLTPCAISPACKISI